jgi:hypothetical protein
MQTDDLDILEKTALDLGCSEAKIIPVDQVVVEDRYV